MTGLYGLLVSAVVGVVLAPFEVVRRALGRSSARDLRERLRGPSGPAGCVVVHAVSAGEVVAASALVARLAARAPELRVLLTTTNDAGRRAAERLAAREPGVAGVGWLPWDRPRAMRRWFESLRPRAVVVVETEIWPGLFLAAKELAVPLLVASGRIYPEDVARYRLATPFFRRVLGAASWIGVKSGAERARFLAIGAPENRVEIAGDLKHDAPPEPPEALSGEGPVIVAGSTHAPEEELLLDAAVGLRASRPSLRLILAPRDTRRAGAIAAAARARGLAVTLLSEIGTGAAAVVVVDTIGRLPSLWGGADVAFVGGTLAPVGGHNPLEPAAHGRAIVLGPHTGHVADAVARLEAAGAVVRVANASELGERLAALLDDVGRRVELGRRARAVFAEGSGAAELCVARLLALAPDGGASTGSTTPPTGVRRPRSG